MAPEDPGGPSARVDRLIPNTARRKPNWVDAANSKQTWIWAAVALACDISPSAVDINSAQDRTAPDLEQFWDRYKVSVSNLYEGSLEYILAEGLELARLVDQSVVIVDLVTFAEWAQGLPYRWELPGEFPGRSDVNWSTWGRSDVAEVWQAASIATGHSPDGMSFQQAKASFGTAFGEMLESAMRCLRITLPVLAYEKPNGFDYFGDNPPTKETQTKVRLDKFRDWAESKGYTLPARFPKATKGSEPKPEPPLETSDSAIDTKTKTSLLVIIGALAKRANVDLAHPTVAAKTIVDDLAAMGVTIGQRTVEEHLKAVDEALDRKG